MAQLLEEGDKGAVLADWAAHGSAGTPGAWERAGTGKHDFAKEARAGSSGLRVPGEEGEGGPQV